MAEKGAKLQGIGRSRGGQTTKIHVLTDGCGKAVAFLLTPGNIADISVAPQLLASFSPARRLLADKGYHANSLHSLGCETVIPQNATGNASFRMTRSPIATEI